MPATIPATSFADVAISTCHDAVSGERITHLRHMTRTVRILERRHAQPVCMIVPSQVGARCVIQTMPWPMTHDDAVAFWALTLVGHTTSPTQIAMARELLNSEAA